MPYRPANSKDCTDGVWTIPATLRTTGVQVLSNGLLRANSQGYIDAQVDADSINEHRCGWPQHGKLLSQSATKVPRLGVELVDDDRRIEIVLILQESAWALDLDSPGSGRCGWEVPLVIGDDHSRPGLHRGGQHMTILGIVGHLLNQWFVAGHP